MESSHHPPITAYSIHNKQHGVHLTGSTAPKTSFTNTIHITQSGYALLSLSHYNETYHITLPPLHVEGLLSGSPCIELSKTSYIRSSSGYTAKIDYSGRGWLGQGKRTGLTASLYPSGRENDVLYTIDGQWSSKLTIRNAKTNQRIEIFDGAKHPSTPLKLAPIEKQDPFESRRAWRTVTAGIVDGNMEVVNREKCKIENQQRELRKRERAEGRVWKRRYFEMAEVDGEGVWRLNRRGEVLLGVKPGSA